MVLIYVAALQRKDCVYETLAQIMYAGKAPVLVDEDYEEKNVKDALRLAVCEILKSGIIPKEESITVYTRFKLDEKSQKEKTTALEKLQEAIKLYDIKPDFVNSGILLGRLEKQLKNK